VLEIFDQRIEKLQQEIARAHDFTLSGHVHSLYGMCAECRAGGAGGKR
jgi:Fur family ferric uptake transcriptional regulator